MHFLQPRSSLLIPSKQMPSSWSPNTIYDAFIASKIPTTKASFLIWKHTEVRKS